MPDLPKKKIGIVSCSGEELAEGTVTRLAALRVLEQLRPGDTVTICLPLFLAGGEGDRAFARFYPTIAVDGCELRCAARATEMYSSKPAASIMVREVVAENGLAQPEGRRRLSAAGLQVVEATARQMAATVDELLGKSWDRKSGSFVDLGNILPASNAGKETEIVATCSCGSGIPIQKVQINGKEVTLVALPVIFQQFHDGGKPATPDTIQKILDAVKIYNLIPADEDEAYIEVLSHEYAIFSEKEEAAR
jgi:uncharacterized metal-binding protein